MQQITTNTTKTNHYFRVVAALVALTMAASLLVQSARPVQAAFPGQNGSIVFASDRDGDFEIYRTSMCIICKTKLTNNSAKDTLPAVSPDGKKIAFVSDRDGNNEIYVMDRDGSNQTRLTNNPAADWWPAFSPDGKKIAFASDRDGNNEIYAMNAEDTNGDGNGDNPTNRTNNPAEDWTPAWSPKGDKIAFTSERDGNFEVYTMNPGGANQTNLTNSPAGNDGGEGGLDFSPDGKQIAYTNDQSFTGWEVYVMNSADGTDQTNLTNFGSANHPVSDYHPAFSPDGGKIAFTRDAEIYVMDADDGANQTNLTNPSSAYDYAPDWGPRTS